MNDQRTDATAAIIAALTAQRNQYSRWHDDGRTVIAMLEAERDAALARAEHAENALTLWGATVSAERSLLLERLAEAERRISQAERESTQMRLAQITHASKENQNGS